MSAVPTRALAPWWFGQCTQGAGERHTTNSTLTWEGEQSGRGGGSLTRTGLPAGLALSGGPPSSAPSRPPWGGGGGDGRWGGGGDGAPPNEWTTSAAGGHAAGGKHTHQPERSVHAWGGGIGRGGGRSSRLLHACEEGLAEGARAPATGEHRLGGDGGGVGGGAALPGPGSSIVDTVDVGDRSRYE
jgi:hypothetical protein